METNFITRKQSLEEEIKLTKLLLAFEHRTDMRNKIRLYMNKIERELLEILR